MSCFENTPISFSYLTNIEKFDVLIQNSQWKTKEDYDDEFKNEDILGERKVGKLIVMDNVLGLADKPNDFGSFFNRLQKIWIYVIFLFHILYLSNVNWQAIISQTKIFKIFPDSIQVASAAKILSSNCNCETFDYILNRDLWFNQLYFEISNSKNHTCLTIICRSFNSSGQSKYRTRAENAHDQFCYFNHRKKDKFFK